jgi:hypothetical protein
LNGVLSFFDAKNVEALVHKYFTNFLSRSVGRELAYYSFMGFWDFGKEK